MKPTPQQAAEGYYDFHLKPAFKLIEVEASRTDQATIVLEDFTAKGVLAFIPLAEVIGCNAGTVKVKYRGVVISIKGRDKSV